LACRVPVIATKVGGIPEIIHSEDYGILVEGKVPEDFVEAISNGLKKRWNPVFIEAYAHSHSWDRIAGKIHRCFQDVLTGSLPEG
jgi:glycosyltransferase involved in cell wall biosynthesis